MHVDTANIQECRHPWMSVFVSGPLEVHLCTQELCIKTMERNWKLLACFMIKNPQIETLGCVGEEPLHARSNETGTRQENIA